MEALKYNDLTFLPLTLVSGLSGPLPETQPGTSFQTTTPPDFIFIVSAHETADNFPTSFYGIAFHGQSWEMETPLNRVGGDKKSVWIATQVM